MSDPTFSAASAARCALAVHDVSYAFPGEPPLLQDLNFRLAAGEFVSLLAPSGAGKSTVFRLAAGLLEPSQGEIRLNDRDGRAVKQRLGRVGYMPQKDGLLPWRTVLDNAALGLELQGVPKREARAKAAALLPAFGLADTGWKRPYQLSGGMRQRVSFLRTVLGGGELLLLDEPFSALDALTRVTLQEWLLALWEAERRTILFITHDPEEALLLSDRVLVGNGSPLGRLQEIVVPFERPRRYELVRDPQFGALKLELLRLLRGETEGGVAP